MAYDRKFLNPGGSPAAPGPCSHTYSTADAFATVEADGYFDEDAGHFDTGDILWVYSSHSTNGGLRRYVVTRTADDIALTAAGAGAVYLPFTIPETELLAGTSIELVAPCAGRITGLRTVVQEAISTGGTITVEVDGTAVDGLSIAVESLATKGTVQSDAPTAGHASAAVAAGDRLEIQPANFADAGAVSGVLEITPTV